MKMKYIVIAVILILSYVAACNWAESTQAEYDEKLSVSIAYHDQMTADMRLILTLCDKVLNNKPCMEEFLLDDDVEFFMNADLDRNSTFAEFESKVIKLYPYPAEKKYQIADKIALFSFR